MKLRTFLFFYGWFISVYLVLLMVGVIGWVTGHKDWCMTMVLIAIVYYHVGCYFLDMIPVALPAPILPPDDTI